MSRIGKRPLKLTQGVEVNFKERLLSVKGPKGELELRAHPAIELIIDTENISVLPSDLSAPITPMLGTTRALISNMIHGVTEGFQKQLNLVGVGYKAVVNQKKFGIKPWLFTFDKLHVAGRNKSNCKCKY